MFIAWILGIVFALLLVGACVGAFFAFDNEKSVVGAFSTVGAVIMLLLLICIPGSFHTVDAGSVAVIKRMGSISHVRTAGTHFDFWMTDTYTRYDAKVQTLDILAPTYSKDNQPMDISLTVQWHINTDEVKDIAVEYGNLSILSDRISTVVSASAKEVLGTTEAESLIATRSAVTEKILEKVSAELSAKYHAEINSLLLTNIDFSDEFEAAVEAKMKAQQEKLQADYENEKKEAAAETAAKVAAIEAEAKIKVAKAEAEAKIEAAKGNAEAQKKIADAEAYATQIKVVELARSMGYQVNDILDEETGEVVGYEVVWGDDSTGQQVILQYLQYLEYLAKWDGKLPEVVAGDSGVVVPVTPSYGENNG